MEKLVSYVALLDNLAPVVSRSQVQNTKCDKVCLFFFFPLASPGPGFGVPPTGPGFGGYPQQTPVQSYAGGGPAQIPGV